MRWWPLLLACAAASACVCLCACHKSAPNGSASDDGRCVPFEPYPGYKTCLLDKPQVPVGGGVPVGAGNAAVMATTQRVGPALTSAPASCVTIHDQGQCGWCVAHATAAAIELLACEAGRSVRVSEPHLWYEGHGKQSFDGQSCKSGWNIPTALATTTRTLLADEALWPYRGQQGDATKMNRTPPEIARIECEAIHDAIPPHTFTQMQVARDLGVVTRPLAAGLPVIVAVPVYRGTGWTYGDATYGSVNAPAQPPPQDCTCKQCPKQPNCLIGYHAILLVSHDPKTSTFRFQNSWGTGFAKGGYATIDDAFFTANTAGGGWFDSYAYGKTSCTPLVPPAADTTATTQCSGKLSGAVERAITSCSVTVSPVNDTWRLAVHIDQPDVRIPGGDNELVFRGNGPVTGREYQIGDALDSAVEIDVTAGGTSSDHLVYMVDKKGSEIGGKLRLRFSAAGHGQLHLDLYCDSCPPELGVDPTAPVALDLAF